MNPVNRIEFVTATSHLTELDPQEQTFQVQVWYWCAPEGMVSDDGSKGVSALDPQADDDDGSTQYCVEILGFFDAYSEVEAILMAIDFKSEWEFLESFPQYPGVSYSLRASPYVIDWQGPTGEP